MIGLVPGIALSEILVRDIADFMVFVQIFVMVIAGIAGISGYLFNRLTYVLVRGFYHYR